jgi:hypothetical protein
MGANYQEVGGMRWGNSYSDAMNATWPFATLRATSESLSVTISALGLLKRQFDFTKAEIKGVRKFQGFVPFLSTGIVIEHAKPEYPPFLIFWTINFRRLATELQHRGFCVRYGDL